jgi:hypothetical protein
MNGGSSRHDTGALEQQVLDGPPFDLAQTFHSGVLECLRNAARDQR